MPYLGVLDTNFEKLLSYCHIGKTIVIISVLDVVLLQSLVQKKKSLNLVPKLPDLDIFVPEF